MIKAECHSDDHVVEAEFDAADWFTRASADAILALADCNWGGDYAADAVADFYRDSHPGVGDMFTYLDLRRGAGAEMGFECHVDAGEAMAWLRNNRPRVHQRILWAEAGDLP